MKRLIAVFYLLSTNSYAGIETLLLDHKFDNCTIRISHDALASSNTATLILRSYQKLNSVHEPCAPTKQNIRDSLERALTKYQQQDLKPVTSIAIGRLIRYPWIRRYLAAQPPLPKDMPHHDKIELFNSNAFIDQNLSPFRHALARHQFKICRTDCEKILFDKNRLVIDAQCWLLVYKDNK